MRKSFLAGRDDRTGIDYSFHREWIRRRMEALASVFGIDVLTYAIMSNHLHVILRNRPDVVAAWSDEGAALRWLKVFPGRRLDEQLAEPTGSDVKMLVADGRRATALVRHLVVYAGVKRTDRSVGQQAGRMHRSVLGGPVQGSTDR